MSFPNNFWKFKWEIYGEPEFMVSPGAFSDGLAAGRDQTWANVWKRLSATRWEVSAGKQMPPIWLLSVENTEGVPERLVKWRSTLL